MTPQNLTECDREPIHIPGSIQPHGILLAMDAQGRVAQASRNAAAALGYPEGGLQGNELSEVLGAGNAALLPTLQSPRLEHGPEYLRAVKGADGLIYQGIAHRQDGILILELERAPDNQTVRSSGVFGLVQDFMIRISTAVSVEEINDAAAREIRTLTSFDRVMIYRFDADWNGTVVAENRNDELPSYLDLRFPASDIPAQARELYRKNRLRLIPDANFSPILIEPTVHPETGRPLDLTFSVLRSISPIHVQYMKNMGTSASMSISILREGKLWGLISCHNRRPRYVPLEVRGACDVIAQVLSSQLAAADHKASSESRIALKSTQTRLLTYMAEEDPFIDGLSSHPDELFACTRSAGAAIVFGGNCRTFGVAPAEADVRQLASWLRKQETGQEVFATDSLCQFYEPAKGWENVASGLIAASISALHESYIMWFRPELVQTVKWGGDPNKTPSATGQLTPRNSFEIWKEQVRGRSEPWTESEVDSATDLRQAIIRIVLKKAEEVAQLFDELQKSNAELEAFSYSVSHDLRAPFRHISGFAELLREREGEKLSESGQRYVSTIIEAAHFAGLLVDNLLNFSRIGRAALQVTPVDSRKLVLEAKTAAMRDEVEGRSVEWKIGELPKVHADMFMLRLVFQNLISNALKYTRPREHAVIEVTSEIHDAEIVFTIRDNGVGFDARYSDKLFGVFQRLHRMEEFEGTGIGLANVHRVVTRHGGRVWADSTIGQGATFSFSLPRITETA